MKTLDLVNPVRGDIPFSFFTFPDGQPHFELTTDQPGEWDHVQILTSIKNVNDIALLGLAVESVRSVVKGRITVNIGYMLGARMDRPIGPGKPHSLKVLAAMVNAACSEANDFRVIDPHSKVTTDLLNRCGVINPDKLVQFALRKQFERYNETSVIVTPDAGAVSRTEAFVQRLNLPEDLAFCSKKRDSVTGKLSGFELTTGNVKDRHCLIVDDLCDGGGTFVGIANVLKEQGALSVSLCVTHAILSKGIDALAGIDTLYTTDSYRTIPEVETRINAITYYQGVPNEYPNQYVMTDFLGQWVKGPK